MNHQHATLPRIPGRRKTRRSLVGFSFGLTLLGFPAAAQSTTPSDRSEEERAVVLSPFEVTADQDTGYLASSAQSGTRLRTDLKDIASSVSVITKDFMNDIGAKDLETLLIYTLGTEVGGVGGNFADAGVVSDPNGSSVDYDAAFANALPSTRVRGLTTADLSRDFFVTRIPVDNYNTERVEISRGPNAMLFGLGSPSGIINYSLAQARLDRTRTEVEHRMDQYGSHRGTIDHNQVLIKDKLALRVNGVWDKQYYRVEEAYKDDRRLQVAVTYRPFENTTLRARIEKGAIDSNRPEIRPPGDAYTQWWYMGRPTYDPSVGGPGGNGTGMAAMLGTPADGWPAAVNPDGSWATTGSNTLGSGRAVGSNYTSGQIGAITASQMPMVLVYSDPTSNQLGLTLNSAGAVDGFRGGSIANVHANQTGDALVADYLRGVRDMSRILNYTFHSDDITFGFWKSTQISDPAIYDFYDHMLHGPNKAEWADFISHNITLEQRLFDGRGGLELSFNRDSLDNGSMMGLDSVIAGYTLRIDINTHLPNGDPNPNFGRPFVTGYTRLSVRSYDNDTLRGTAYYDLDLRKVGPSWLGNILGHHRFTGSYTRLDNEALLKNNNFVLNSGTDYQLAARGQVLTASSAGSGAPILHYLGPDVSASPTPATGAITTMTNQLPLDRRSVSLLWYDPPATSAGPTGPWSTRSFSIRPAEGSDPSQVLRYASSTREKIDSAVAVMQSFWLNGKVVSTLGLRQDKVQTFNASTPPNDPSTGLSYLPPDWVPLPATTQKETSFNWGIVGHAPDFIQRHLPLGTEISVLINRADNFQPAGQRYNLRDEAIPAETGNTKEYGVMLSTFNGKLVLRATKYETRSALSSSLVSSLTTPLNNLSDLIAGAQGAYLQGLNGSELAGGTKAWEDWYNSPVGQMLRKTFRITEAGTDVTGDRRTGEVVETADVVSKGYEFEVVYNPLKNWRMSFNASRAEAVRTNVAPIMRDVVFNSLVPLANGPAGQIRASTTGTGTLQNTVLLSIRNQMLPELANEGAPTNELRKWHWNYVTNYSFTEGRLKGWNIGASVRWQDKIAIGYPIIQDPVLGNSQDVRHPYYGPSTTDYGAWVGYQHKFQHFDWAVQLNVSNIGVHKELEPISAQPDGSIAGWRIRPEEMWTLRNTFTF